MLVRRVGNVWLFFFMCFAHLLLVCVILYASRSWSQGASKDGLFVPLEAVAVVAAIALAIFAQSKKSNL